MTATRLEPSLARAGTSADGAIVRRSGWALLWWCVLTVGGGTIVGLASNGGGSLWYVGLDKPSWTPPSWVFAPVWAALYGVMGVAAWLVWRQGGWARHAQALGLFELQLALNFAWSPLFFNAQRPSLALIDIVGLWLVLALTVRTFYGVTRWAGLLLVPYLCWVTYAAALNAAIVGIN